MFRIYFLITYFICVQSCADHYWNDYNGSIPPDAILAGHNNKTNCPSYIGQVYVHHHGLYQATINPGSMEVLAPCYGVVKTNIIIKNGARGLLYSGKYRLRSVSSQPYRVTGSVSHLLKAGSLQNVILCAPDPSKYDWVPTTAATFREDMEGEMPIIGGYDQKNWDENHVLGTINIGRVFEDDRAIVGNVGAYFDGNILFYYPLKGKQITTSRYEVLVYRNKGFCS